MSKMKIGCLGVIGLLVLFMIIGALAGGGDKSSKDTASSTKVEQSAETKQESKKEAKQQKEYTPIDVGVLMSDLENNAAAAQKKYKGKSFKITGKLGNIDSDGDYISIQDPNDKFAVRGVHCTINKKDKAQEDYVLNLKKDQMVVAYGTITDVGELMAYSMKVDKFE